MSQSQLEAETIFLICASRFSDVCDGDLASEWIPLVLLENVTSHASVKAGMAESDLLPGSRSIKGSRALRELYVRLLRRGLLAADDQRQVHVSARGRVIAGRLESHLGEDLLAAIDRGVADTSQMVVALSNTRRASTDRNELVATSG